MATPISDGAGPSGSRPPRRFTSEQARDLFRNFEADTSDDDLDLDLEVLDSDSGEEGWPDDDSRSEESSDEEPPAAKRQYRKGKGKGKRSSSSASTSTSRSSGDVDLNLTCSGRARENAGGEHRVWRRATVEEGTTNQFPFRGDSGPKINLGERGTPLQYLQQLLDIEIVDEFITQINDYAEVQIQKNTPLRKYSMFSAWSPLTRYEVYKFFAVLITIGMNPRPLISDYWSTLPHMYTPWFSQMFSRRQFQLIYHSMLHVCQPDANSKAKIEPFINILLKKFQATFYPFENCSVDEMVIGFKGRFKHKQYNASKPKKHHIKTFGLCDSATGYIFNILTYFGVNTSYSPDTDPNAQQAVKVFATLLEPLTRSGHHLFADRLYTSLPLIDFLRSKRINYTGTLNTNRVGFPPEIKTLNLAHMEQQWFIKEGNDILLVAWKDKKSKKPCVVVTSKGQVGSVTKREGMREVEKPTIIDAYNNSMNGCDRADQMLSYYSTHNRRTRRWWRKLFHWIIEVCQINAHILYVLNQPQTAKRMSLQQFKHSLIQDLTAAAGNITPERLVAATPAKGRLPATNDVERLQGAKHLPDFSGADRECVLCRKNGTRKRTSYFCTGCSNKPHLCVKTCFRLFHTKNQL